MRQRNKKKDRKETVQALAMILQMGLTTMTCMGMSLAIGYYIDRLFQTKIWVMVMTFVGIMAAIRSMLILTGKYHPGGEHRQQDEEFRQDEEERTRHGKHEDGQN